MDLEMGVERHAGDRLDVKAQDSSSEFLAPNRDAILYRKSFGRELHRPIVVRLGRHLFLV
jgi:hypothetical protein